MTKKKIFLRSLLLSAVAVISLQSTAAAAGINYNNLIDDYVFDNYGTMNAGSIDSFLNGFPNSCISTNAGFSAPDPIGYNPTDKFQYGGLVSAGTVIAHAAQAYEINPQVLIATLQKEQGIVVGDGPNIVRNGTDCGALAISASMGYNCPDGLTLNSYSGFTLYAHNGTPRTSVNNTCVENAAYVGFSRQIINAAWLLTFDRHRSEGLADWYIVKPNWDNSDDANFCYSGPTTEGTFRTCPSGATTFHDGYVTIDGSALHMDNGATAALYHYTPHKHGQELFYNLFTAWFGSVYGVYKWTSDGYQVFNKTETQRVDPGFLQPGEEYVVKLYAINIGTATWLKSGSNPFNLATTTPPGHNSFLCHQTWLACNRTGSIMEQSVAPGQGGNFKFTIRAPFVPGSYREYFQPVAEMLRWSAGPDISLGIRVVSPGSFLWHNAGYKVLREDESAYMDPGNLEPGKTYLVKLHAINTGSATWRNSGPTPVNLGTSQGTGRSSVLCTNTWSTCSRPVRLQESSVAPGQMGHFLFKIKMPYGAGDYREYFKPVAEMMTWMNDSSEPLGVRVNSPGTYRWSNGGYKVLNQSESAFMNPGDLQSGQIYIAKLQAVNTGTATWRRDGNIPFTLGTANPEGHNSVLCDGTWLSCNRPVYLQESSVAPGQVGNFKFFFTAPAPGTYREYFKPLAEFMSWTNDTAEPLGIVVH